jgi:hypothetical protein
MTKAKSKILILTNKKAKNRIENITYKKIYRIAYICACVLNENSTLLSEPLVEEELYFRKQRWERFNHCLVKYYKLKNKTLYGG